MLKRVVVDIMQNIAPAFVVACVLLCLSFSYTLPLHRAHPNDLTELSNRSQKCGTATANRPKKMTPTDKQDFGLDDFSEAARQYAETAKRKLSGDDLRQYEQLVIMKKYPYLDLKEFELKYGPSVKNAKYEYVRDAEIAGGGDGECKLTDDGPHVEIFNRGISGFAIPKSPTNVLKSEQVPRSENMPDDVRLRGHPRGRNSFKDLAGNDLY